jgi:hypothetical protein
MGLVRLSLYMLGIAAGLAAIIIYKNRPAAVKTNSTDRFPFSA